MSINTTDTIYQFLNLPAVQNAVKGPDGKAASLTMAEHLKTCYKLKRDCRTGLGGAKKSRRRTKKKRRRRRKSTKKKRRRKSTKKKRRRRRR